MSRQLSVIALSVLLGTAVWAAVDLKNYVEAQQQYEALIDLSRFGLDGSVWVESD